MTLKQLSIYFIVVLGFFSCTNQHGQNNKQLLQTVLQEVNVDSAFHLLSSIETNLLSDRDFAVYTILNVRLKEKVGQDISKDTLVFKAKDYLLLLNDSYTDVALFVSANVHDSRGETTQAINNFLESINRTKDDLLNSHANFNIARLYCSQGAYKQSLELLSRMNRYCNDVEYVYHMRSFELKALNYLYLNKLDSALNYFNEAEKLALLHNDRQDLLRIIQNTSFALCEAKDYKQAKEKCIKAIKLVGKEDSEILGILQVTQSYLYDHAGQIDSAYICISKAYDLLKDTGNDMIEMYRLFSLIEEKRGNFKQAMHYNQLHFNAKEAANERRIKYQKANQDNSIQKIQQERDEYLKSKSDLHIVIGFLLLTLLVALLVVAFFINRERFRAKFRDIKNNFIQFQKEAKIEKAKHERVLKEIQIEREKEHALLVAEREEREREQSEKEDVQRERAREQLLFQTEKEEIQKERVREQELYQLEKEQLQLEWEKGLAILKDQTVKEKAEFVKYQELTLQERNEYLSFKKEAIDSREQTNQEKEAFRIFKKTAEKEKEQLQHSIKEFVTEKEILEEAINISKTLCKEERKRLINLIQDISKLGETLDANPVNYKEVRRGMKQINSRMFFDTIFPVLDYAYNGLLMKLRDDYPQLTEPEYQLFVLACAGFSSKEISIIMQIATPHSADSRKTTIREKLNLKPRTKFHNFFCENYGISDL